jgi:hypothetical protein
MVICRDLANSNGDLMGSSENFWELWKAKGLRWSSEGFGINHAVFMEI